MLGNLVQLLRTLSIQTSGTRDSKGLLVDLASLILTDTYLLLPPKCGIKDVCVLLLPAIYCFL